ncbi:ACP S-malonyltransferase [Verrucomicrobiaceae bacterium R5-34]|uniref:Malonyl CoA-acyl carrier protein transacylase n=1 Tax=Oceaniferula flava TaxID=2800421 RepID=A0AAE2S8N2_9BACT|nr:ACP S-malonyltransferase [Oceaniferula flavus]MBK1829132.1 ACP S-malonyltransferase [Verrucomicrobiaceae bacterium R5-34]MBK1853368.1 ACP S-malonyltransferase [Oceaniferula flavus]MBM1134673.1 ACP S-malonyltransferase [Oceaniferula flavus]
MSNVVILFSGQGAQKVGMGKDLVDAYPAAKALFAKADEALGYSLSDIMFNGPDDQLTRTAYCQPALYLHGLACLEVLKEKVPSLKPVAAAGLSLGEFTAHAAAGTFDFATGLNLVAQRGAFMEEACEATDGAMAAMIGGDEAAVEKLAADCDVDVANFNAIGQIVLSGSEEGIDKAVAGAKAAGIRMGKKLKVAGAYHSRLMQSAQDQLAGVLAETEISEPSIPVICNFGAREVQGSDDIKSMLEQQVTGSVRWTSSMQQLIADGHTKFIELGPGKVLAGLMGRIDKNVEVMSVEDVDSLEAAVAALK